MKICVLILSFLFLSEGVFGQTTDNNSNLYSLTLRNVSIERALIELSDISNIDFAYDSQLELDTSVFIDERNKSVDQILKKILSFSNLDYVILSTGTYVITASPTMRTEYGNFSGYVRDAETGEPLANATIFIADATGSTSTNSSGYFSISSLMSGEYDIYASYVGYKSQKSSVVIGPDSKGLTVIELTPTSYMMEPLVVSSNLPTFMAGDFQDGTLYSTIDDHYIGADRNVVQSLKTFPGISFSAGQQNFYIQGSDSRDHLVTLDGVPIYNSTISGNTFGIFSPYSIDRIEVLKSGFGATEGSSLSGYVNFKHDINNRRNSSHTLQADPYAINARIEIPASKESSWSSMIGARINIWDLYEAPNLSKTFDQWNQLDPLLQNFIMGTSNDIAHYNSMVQDSDVLFYDLHFALSRSANYSTTKISAYLGKNFIDTRLLSDRKNVVSQQPEYVFSEDKSTQNNAMINLEHTGILSARVDYLLKAYFTLSKFENDYRMIGDNDLAANGVTPAQAFVYFSDENSMPGVSANKNSIEEFSIESGLKYNIGTRSELRAGLEPKIISYNFSLSDLFYFPTTTSQTSFILSSYSELTHNFNNKAKIELGGRATYLPETTSFYFEPRFTARYLTDNTSTGYHSFKFSTGIYRQFINRFDLASFGPSALIPSYKFWQPNDQTTEVPRSYHTAFSWSVTPSDAFVLSVESYYKWMPVNWRLNYHALLQPQVTSGITLQDQSSYFSRSEGYSYGGSLTTEYRLKEPKITFNLMHQVNISKEKVEDRFDEQMISTEWSEPYSLSSFINWNVFKNFNTLVNFNWIPVRYWAYNKAYYDYLGIHGESAFGRFNLSSPQNNTLPSYFRLDLGFNYSISISSGFKLEAKLDLVNILNRKNPVYYTLTPQFQTNNNVTYNRNSKTLPGFTPSFSVELSF